MEIQERQRDHQSDEHEAGSRSGRDPQRRCTFARQDGAWRQHGREYTRSQSPIPEKSLKPLRALVFDAYGTLFDVHSVVELCDRTWPGKGVALSQLWRAKQLEYTWLRSLMRRYRDFAQVTADALDYACAALGLAIDDARRRALLAAYQELATFPEVRATLAALKASRIRLAILSNGSPGMLRPLVAHAGLGGLIGTILSVDARKIYKPAPEVYRLAVERLRVPKRSIGFVSSNGWDACGAKSFGFRVFWVNRGGAPADALGAPPDHVIRRLDELPELVRAPVS